MDRASQSSEDASHAKVFHTTPSDTTSASSAAPKKWSLISKLGAAAIFIALFGIWLWLTVRIFLDNPQYVTVSILQGTYAGIDVKSDFPQTLQQFLGIPYAQSPTGERRFLPPVPVNASQRTFHDASKYGNRCPSGTADNIPQSEDCLNLNIYRPKERAEGTLLPVLIYIHGGSFNFGFGSDRNINNMVGWSSEPFIGVSFNYRLGALGFLPSNLTAREGLLNIGLKDQDLLFQWVQDNIAAFGGNPKDVTIMGVSAGAHSVGHHIMRHYDPSPPFHKAIIESGATTARAVYPPTNAMYQEQFDSFISKLGLSSVPEDQLLSKLRSQDVNAIKSASDAVYDAYNPSIRWPFQPVIDGPGGLIPTAPISAWEAGNWTRVPILTGFNTDEGALFVPHSPATNKDFTDFFHTLLPNLSDQDIKVLQTTYPDPVTDPNSPYRETARGVGAQFDRLEQAYGQFAYVAPVRQTARYVAADDEERKDGGVPVYLYHFAVNSSVLGGADHGDHDGFVTYDKSVRERSDTLGEVAGLMHDYWTSFITRGDPNALKGFYPDREKWPAYTTAQPKLALFGEGNDEHAGGGHKGTPVSVANNSWALEECQYWWNRTKLFES